MQGLERKWQGKMFAQIGNNILGFGTEHFRQVCSWRLQYVETNRYIPQGYYLLVLVIASRLDYSGNWFHSVLPSVSNKTLQN